MIRLRLLGGATIEDDGDVLDGAVARRHPIALMAVLAADPSRTVGRSKVVGLLWPDSPEDRARGRLNSCLHRVRKQLGEDSVLSVGDDLSLNGERLASDVEDFRAALEAGDHRSAVDAYGGPFLDGFRLPESSSFEQWVDRVRDRLGRSYREALESLAEEAEARQDPASAADWWNERVSDDPLDSRAVCRLMTALARAGNPAAALRAGRVHERLVQEELGTGPGSEVRELLARLERGEGFEPPPGDVEPQPPSSRTPPDAFRSAIDVEGPAPATSPASRIEPGAPTGDGRRTAIGSGWLVAAVVTLLAVGAAAAWLLRDTGATASGKRGATSVAVLPFGTIGATSAELLAEGLHADLLTRLSHVTDLTVVSGTSVQRYRESGVPIPVVADELNVDWVVEGSVQAAGEEVQVNVQLIDAQSDSHEWARTYRRELGVDSASAVFEVQGELAAHIAGSVGARLSDAERSRIRRQPTDDLGAFRLYVEGRRHLDQRTPEGFRRAVEAFGQALGRDSSYALAWSGLADAVDLARTYGVELEPEVPEPAAAARRALELDPELGVAHASLARAVFREDLSRAVELLRRAVALQPGYAQAHHWLGYFELAFGDLARATEHLELATRLDPGLLPARGMLARARIAEGRYAEALSMAQETAALQTSWAWGTALNEVFALAHLGRWSELREAVRSHREAGAFAEPGEAMLVLADVAEGREAVARERLSRITHWFYLGLSHAALGELDAAFRAFDRSGEDALVGPTYLTAWRYYFPDVFGPMRADARFDRLMREVRVRWGLEPGGGLPSDSG